MATDKSLNIRQVKATEDTAAAIAELRQMMVTIQAQLQRIEAAVLPAQTATQAESAAGHYTRPTKK